MKNDGAHRVSAAGVSKVEGSGGTKGSVLVQSVDRAVAILEILASRGEVGVSDLAGELGVHKSTAFRLVNVLCARGLVEQPGERGKSRLGFGIMRLAGATAARLDLNRQSRPVSERLAAIVGETVSLAVADAGSIVNIDQVLGSAAVSSHNWVGQATPAHATSSGKVLLAFMPDAGQDAVLAGELERYTPHTVTDPEELRDQLRRAVKDGYACTVEELEVGLNAAAAPIRSYDRRVVAALSVSGPSYRLTRERLDAVAPSVIAHANEISSRLGYLH
jgi:DNA-binding IclR family transcriptional regulator